MERFIFSDTREKAIDAFSIAAKCPFALFPDFRGLLATNTCHVVWFACSKSGYVDESASSATGNQEN
jgi:hypothetical protein